ncbi:MAG: hypothetical protein JWN93_563 [Hyphomicrobiales bacterium]|nr:hypothetical protein [Hyphomicrobiales bacterium]
MAARDRDPTSDQPSERRPHVPPEQTSVNVQRQAPMAPGSDGEDYEADSDRIDPQDEPAHAPDEKDVGPVADRARGEQALWDRQDADPEGEEDADDDAEG